MVHSLADHGLLALLEVVELEGLVVGSYHDAYFLLASSLGLWARVAAVNVEGANSDHCVLIRVVLRDFGGKRMIRQGHRVAIGIADM